MKFFFFPLLSRAWYKCICRPFPDSKPGSAVAAPIDFTTICPPTTQLPPNPPVKAAIVIGLNKESGPPNARGRGGGGEIMFQSARSVRLSSVFHPLSNGAKICLAPLFISDLTPQPRQAMREWKFGFKSDNLPPIHIGNGTFVDKNFMC
ncbi:unnamed protein product [Penicillium camemberti]|uniref:Str. FM013 n=1 Tax=Penicillium camemberti (strain FM 013) TaxID=1429867 RepID=A0A0G4P912_PENC3|nr:unnamed protein product [Penicillium camemberti]